jgi:hypothetical protein
MMATQKKGGGSRKLGRNKAWCLVYKTLDRRFQHKQETLARHIRDFAGDLQAANAYRSRIDKHRNLGKAA